MNQEHEDYEDLDARVAAIDSSRPLTPALSRRERG